MRTIEASEWQDVSSKLSGAGYAKIPGVLDQSECNSLMEMYSDERMFRSTINMERYRFGKGEYKYFQYPLPDLIRTIRTSFYPALVSIANEWMRNLNIAIAYPNDHEAFIAECHAAGQNRPTPLILRYDVEGFNTLHQDLYGNIYFPFQVVFPLTRPNLDHSGGELVFVEQLPRAQSKAEVLIPDQGDAVIFTTNFRPVKGSKGFYRSKMKHGVSKVTAGRRFSMGVIFHDAL